MVSYFKARSKLFQNSSFSYACAMSFCSAIIVGIAYISISWQLLKIDNSVRSIIIFMLTWWAFGVVLSPLTGYIADLIPRRIIIIVVNISRVLMILLFLLFGSMDSLGSIYLFTFSWGVILAFFMPAMMVMSRELFMSDDVLLYANSTIDGIFEFGMVFGMSLGGALVAYFNLHQIMILMLIVNIFAMLFSFKVVPKRKVNSDKQGFIKNWKEVFSFLNENNALYWCYLAQVGMTCIYMIAPIFVGPYAKNVLHATSFEFGIIEVAFSVGFIVGNILLPYLIEKASPKLTLFLSISILAITYVLLAVNRNLELAVVYYGMVGAFISCWVVVVTIAQKNTPINLQGKIQGVAYGLSGLVVVIVYLIFFMMDYLYSLSSDRWFYILALLALATLWPMFKGLNKLERNV